MGEEFKTGYIDTLNSIHRPKSIITSSNMKSNIEEYREILPIKESIQKISEKFSSELPTQKVIPHGIMDAVYLSNYSDLIIALCYEDYFIKYDLISDQISESKFSASINSIYSSLDETLIIGIGPTEIVLIDAKSLREVKNVPFTDPEKVCVYHPSLILITNPAEVYQFNLVTFEIVPVGIKNSKITAMQYSSQKFFIFSDTKGITKYSDSFEILAYFDCKDVSLVKLSDFENFILAIGNESILIFSADLMLVRTIHNFNFVSDIFYKEKLNMLAFCDSQGNLLVYDMRIEKRKFIIKMNSTLISKLFYRDRKIITLGTDCKISTILVPKLSNFYILPVSSKTLAISDVYSTIAYIENGNELKFWKFKENLFVSVIRLDFICNCIAVDEEFLYISSLSYVFKINIGTLAHEKLEKSTETKYNSMTVCRKHLVCGGVSQLIFIFRLNPFNEIAQLRGHEDYISCLGNFKHYLFSGSLDFTVRVWSIKDMCLKHVLNSHSKKITSVVGTNGKIISASDDRSIKIWYIKSGDLIFSITGIAGSVKSLVTFEDQFLITCSSAGKISYWNLNTYTEMFSNNTLENPTCLVGNDYIIGYSSRKYVFVMRNPIYYNKISVSGPDPSLKYKFIEYCSKILNSNIPEHDGRMDKWIILPFFITPLHIYSYFNLPDYITGAFNNGAAMIQSRFDQNPFSIAVTRDLETCVDSILKPLKLQIEKNPFILSFINNKILIEMNFTNHVCLPKFYNLIFCEVYSEKLPKFISYRLSLPIYSHCPNIMPSSKIFFHEKYIKDIGQPVTFTRSIVKLNLELGSQKSIALLQSIAECKNPEIFNTSFVQAYIYDKWESVKWFMWIQFVIYFSYLCLFCVYMLHFYENKLFLSLPFFVSLLLGVYEVYKACVSKKEYFQDLMNYVDLARALIFIIYYFGRIAGPNNNKGNNQKHKVDQIDNLLLVLTLLTFIRGLSYFRLFESTRHFNHLIYQVIIDSRAFSVLMFYNTVAVAFLLYICFRFQDDFSVYLGYSFLIDIQYLDPTYFNQTQWTVYALSLTINCLMMLSVLISIYYNTFIYVTEVSDIANCRALAFMSLEAERNMFWKRNNNKMSFLQMCSKEGSEKDHNPIMTKVKSIKSSVKSIQKLMEGYLTMKDDFNKIMRANEKISKSLPKNKVKKAERNSKAFLLFILLLKVNHTQDINEKDEGIRKIKKIYKQLKN